MIKSVALLASGLLIAACGALGPGGPGGLDGRDFESVSFTKAGQARPLVPGTQVFLTFYNESTGRGVAVRAGCNTYTASYRFDDGKLITDSNGHTAMGCEKPLLDQEDWVFDFVHSSPSFVLDGTHLTLTNGDLVGTFEDSKVAHPDLALVGPTWTVGTIISGQVAMPAPAVATLTFGADGRVAISTGCNSGTAGYTLSGTIIVFAGIGLTKIGCTGGAGDMERAVLATLNAPGLTYGIGSARLSLRSATAGLELDGK